jgi:valyl-tRNA synthetase
VSQTLLHVLGGTLRLAHPVLPHVTERIWGELGEETVLARAAWPEAVAEERDSANERAVEQAFDFIVKLRQLRAVAQMPPRAPLALEGWPLAPVAALVEKLGGVSLVTDGSGDWRAVDVIAVGDVPVTVLAPGGAENLRPRLEQELAKAEGEIERARKKLADARFVERAPAHLVQEERDKLERFEREAAELRERLAALGA